MKLPRQWRLRKGCEKTLSVKPNTIQPDRVMSSATKRPDASCQLRKDTWQKTHNPPTPSLLKFNSTLGSAVTWTNTAFCLRRFTSWRQSKLLCRVLFLFWSPYFQRNMTQKKAISNWFFFFFRRNLPCFSFLICRNDDASIKKVSSYNIPREAHSIRLIYYSYINEINDV